MCAANAPEGGGEVKSRFVAAGGLATALYLEAAEPVTACPLNRDMGEKRNRESGGETLC
jgi:hypothetical protein